MKRNAWHLALQTEKKWNGNKRRDYFLGTQSTKKKIVLNFFVQAEKKTSKKSKHFKNELLFTLYGDVLYKCERILAGSEQIAFQSNCGENASMKRGLIPLQKKKKKTHEN